MNLIKGFEAFFLSLFSKLKIGSKGGFQISQLVVAIIGLAIAIMVFFALVPSITTSISDANLSGASLALASLVVVVFIAGIILVIVKSLIGK